MREHIKAVILAVTLLAALMPAAGAYAWEAEYNADTGLLPTAVSLVWGLDTFNGIAPTISDGALRIQGLDGTSWTLYSREGWAIDAGVPVTVEARMRVEGTSIGAPVLSIQTKGCFTKLYVYPDHVTASDHSGGGWVTFSGDFTTFRTIRLAYDGDHRAYTWVDGQMAFSFGVGSSGQNGINFGSYLGSGAFDSYWQSVSYSKQFLPVPEPSSLMALAGGLVGFGGLALRRKKS